MFPRVCVFSFHIVSPGHPLFQVTMFSSSSEAPADRNASASNGANAPVKVRHICSVLFWDHQQVRWMRNLFLDNSIFFLTYLFSSIDFPYLSVDVRRVRLQQDVNSPCQPVRQDPQAPLPASVGMQKSTVGGMMAKTGFSWLFSFFKTKSNMSCSLFFNLAHRPPWP